ncbi:MAG: substrate-binding domain-containing protein [Lentisphaeria bacterium]|nr:substrate-binding domain-containing protein [Lentisphaeria bacterium]NQZ69451.1 substrate-binding domain-containing protein [Lentisphaeria bacterium]
MRFKQLCFLSCMLLFIGCDNKVDPNVFANSKKNKVVNKSSKKKIHIGLSMDNLVGSNKQDRDQFIAHAKKLGARVTILTANDSSSRQSRDLNTLIQKKVDAIIILPVPENNQFFGLATAATGPTKRVSIPVIAYGNLNSINKPDLYIGNDYEKIGEAQASYILSRLPKANTGSIIRLHWGDSTNVISQLIKKGQDTILAPHIKAKSIKVLAEAWSVIQRFDDDTTVKLLKKHRNSMDAILASHDMIALEAIDILHEEKNTRKILITGYGGDSEACQRVNAGTQSMTVFCPKKLSIETVVDAAVKLAKGKPSGSNVSVSFITNTITKKVPALLNPIKVIDKKNIDERINASKN